MNTRLTASFRRGNGVKNVTHLPAIILKSMGKRHAKKDIAIAEAYVQGLRDKCTALENKEVLAAEEILFDARTEAASILATLTNSKTALRTIPTTPREENSPSDVRENSRNSSRRKAAHTAITGGVERLARINELIVDVNACLEQRILKTRHLCSKKTAEYILGVRYVDKDFKFEKTYSNTATDSYAERHRTGDELIARTVGALYSGGNSNGNI